MSDEIENWVGKDADEILSSVVNTSRGNLYPIAYSKTNKIKVKDYKSKGLEKVMLLNAFINKEQQSRKNI